MIGVLGAQQDGGVGARAGCAALRALDSTHAHPTGRRVVTARGPVRASLVLYFMGRLPAAWSFAFSAARFCASCAGCTK